MMRFCCGRSSEAFSGSSPQIDRAHAGRSVFDRGGDREAHREERGTSFGFGSGPGRANEQQWAASNGLRRSHAELDTGSTGRRINSESHGFFAVAGKECGGHWRLSSLLNAPGAGLGAEHGMECEVSDMKYGEHD